MHHASLKFCWGFLNLFQFHWPHANLVAYHCYRTAEQTMPSHPFWERKKNVQKMTWESLPGHLLHTELQLKSVIGKMKISAFVNDFISHEILNTCGCNNTTAYIDFSMTSFKRESLNTSGLRPYLFICHGIQCSPTGQCHYYKANLLKQRQLSTLWNYLPVDKSLPLIYVSGNETDRSIHSWSISLFIFMPATPVFCLLVSQTLWNIYEYCLL